jgi:geranylgeranyl pyrophosphate synthase
MVDPEDTVAPPNFASQVDALCKRIEDRLHLWLDSANRDDDRLRKAMAYAVFNGGKRLRPLLVHATGRALGLPASALDAPACAAELIHCYSLVHDDLPAMDDDDLRRGQPTAHLAFDEATAILAGDALQARAFEILATDATLAEYPAAALGMIACLTAACGADGMAGGQALDLKMESQEPPQDELEHMFRLKTGALIRASILMPCCLLPDLSPARREALAQFAESIGLAFQIRDDLLEIEASTEQIGKSNLSDKTCGKATWPGRFGTAAAHARISELKTQAETCLRQVGGHTDPLVWLTERLIDRSS